LKLSKAFFSKSETTKSLFYVLYIPKLLTKSKYLCDLQCAGYLWDLFHNPDKIPKPNKAQQYTFDQGTIIGNLAKNVFPKLYILNY